MNKGSRRGIWVLFGVGIMCESKTTALIWEVGKVYDKKIDRKKTSKGNS